MWIEWIFDDRYQAELLFVDITIRRKERLKEETKEK